VLLGSSHGSLSENGNLGATASLMEVARVFNVLGSKRGNRIYHYWYIKMNHDRLDDIEILERISFLTDEYEQ
jgi:hypothetical protein